MRSTDQTRSCTRNCEMRAQRQQSDKVTVNHSREGRRGAAALKKHIEPGDLPEASLPTSGERGSG